MIVTVTPNPSVDWTLEVRRVVRGEVHRAGRRTVEPSGKGVNISRALCVNEIPTTAVLPVGGPEGAELTRRLRHERVPYVEVPVAGSVRVNITLVEPDGTATKVNQAGPHLSVAEVHALTAAVPVDDGWVDDGWVVAAGSLPPGAAGFYGRLGAAVRAAGGRFAVDTSGLALTDALRAGPDVVKPNVDELAAATSRRLVTLEDVVAAAHSLRRSGAGTVLTSLGADGALLVAEGTVLHGEAPVATPLSTVGAGDALLAGYLAAGDVDPAAALREALSWASASCRLPGSRVPRVGAADRAAVVLHAEVEGARRLTAPPAP